MNAPTHEDIMNELLESVHREADDSWRHGVYVYEVFKRESDNTFWSTSYRLSTDGATNELREGVCPIVQVTPTKKTITTYINVE